jgi:hypothetical protein
MEIELVEKCQRDYRSFLFVQSELVKRHFKWLNVFVEGKTLKGYGTLEIFGVRYKVNLRYSPFYTVRFDRIFIEDVKYHSKIHLYQDESLCIYHPTFDMPLYKTIPLVEMIPWISEWCIHYQEWQKYGIWLGKEIKH